MKVSLLSPKKKTTKLPSEIKSESTGYKIKRKDIRKLSCRNTPENYSKIPFKLNNKTNFNNQILADLCYVNSLLRQKTTESRNNQLFINSSKIKLSKIIDEEINTNNLSNTNKILNHLNVNYNTPQNNNIKLELKIDPNKSKNLKLFSPNEKLMLIGGFRNSNINKHKIENGANTNNSTNNNSFNIFNSNKPQKRNENQIKVNQAAIYLKTDINDNQHSNQKDSNIKIFFGNQNLLKKHLLTNQSSDFGSTNSNNKQINEPKKKIALKGSKVNLNKTREEESLMIIKRIKDELIKETVTNTSSNNESKDKKGKNTIDSKSSFIKTINNGFQGVKSYCPEEIHFYYVNMVQGGKMFEGLIEGECNY